MAAIEFQCSSCKQTFPRKMGKCLECGKWNTLIQVDQSQTQLRSSRGGTAQLEDIRARSIVDIEEEENERLPSSIEGLDHVLGGGFVLGGVFLVAGDPGNGKSTLLLQALAELAKAGVPALYLSGEESEGQISARAARTSSKHRNLYVASLMSCSGDVGKVERIIEDSEAAIVVVDSLQTLRCDDVTGQPGGVNQVRESCIRLQRLAKDEENPVTIVLVCHVTKDGDVAGPKTVSHWVDTVVYLEGEESSDMRQLRIKGKNRFGAGDVMRAFRMTGKGMVDLGEDFDSACDPAYSGEHGKARGNGRKKSRRQRPTSQRRISARN